MKADGGNPWWSSGWLGLCAFTAVDQVQFLVRKLRSHKLRNGAKKKKKERKKENERMCEVCSLVCRVPDPLVCIYSVAFVIESSDLASPSEE